MSDKGINISPPRKALISHLCQQIVALQTLCRYKKVSIYAGFQHSSANILIKKYINKYKIKSCENFVPFIPLFRITSNGRILLRPLIFLYSCIMRQIRRVVVACCCHVLSQLRIANCALRIVLICFRKFRYICLLSPE